MLLTKCPKGTKDVSPLESYKWHYAEDIIRNLTSLYGYREVRTPVFEHTELFLRGIGDTTDVVQKEMYTFKDKGDRSITLKPEGTAGAARAYLENVLYGEPQPIKLYYFTPVFRYENPQAGRLREHHQFGVEVFGAQSASIDAEIIEIAYRVFEKTGIQVTLNINSIGCPKCRAIYNAVLKEYLEKHVDNLCQLCKSRIDKNPMRVIDCKNEKCRAEIADIPVVMDYLCDECQEHFEQLKTYLDTLGIQYRINKKIVRGLDYYTKTVFEFIDNEEGLTVCGGGRYDGLIEQLGGNPTCGIGFGMGLERLLMCAQRHGTVIEKPNLFDVYIASMGEKANIRAKRLTSDLRKEGIKTECDHMNRSFKAMFKYADKMNIPYVLIIGEDEIDAGVVKIKNMSTGMEMTVPETEIINVIKGDLKI